MSQEEAQRKLDERLAKIRELLLECETIAEESQVNFALNVAYGMGGNYYPHPDGKRYEGSPGQEDSEFGWYSSTRSCSGW